MKNILYKQDLKILAYIIVVFSPIMCGIFGLLNNNASVPIARHVIDEAFYATKPRGPEYSVLVEYDGKTTLGFHRLAINGLDSGSHQPFNIDGVRLVCNGEIYNYKKLYEMMGVTPQTHSDCEVIIHLYKRYGIQQCLRMLDGYFAFILVDGDTIYVARDAFGVRPLFVAEASRVDMFHTDYSAVACYSPRFYAFASELKGLVGLFNANVERMNQFAPGTYSKFKLTDVDQPSLRNCVYNHARDEFETPQYWECVEKEVAWRVIGGTSIVASINVLDVFTRIRTSFTDAVRKRVEATDRKIACLLSGGLDSSIVTALVAKSLRSMGRTDRLETYSIGFADSDDLKYARIVADYVGTDHHEIIVTEKEFLDAIPEVIHAIESYDTTSVRASVGNYLVSKYISENSDAKVIFNGDGSDEVMGGYLYMGLAGDAIEFDKECVRLLENIHYFDVLRSDRCIASNGLEARTPFLDSGFVQSYLSIPHGFRFHTRLGKQEKYLFRTAFAAEGLLPQEVIFRKKEAFSDGVSKHSRSWYQIIQEHVNTIDVDVTRRYEHNQPTTREQYYYRAIFEKYYTGRGDVIPYFWMPKYVTATDASARTLDVYKTY
jgi:asparagine synthase (glutamine-hydrolysing)